MQKTGERYAAARAALLAPDVAQVDGVAPLVTSDQAIRERTGRGWEEWFDLLDDWGAGDRPHRDVARFVAEQLGVEPLEWGAQAITVSYERARGGRAVGERQDGFTVSTSKTLLASGEALFAAFAGEAERKGWLPDGQLSARTATAPKSLRFDWGDGTTRVNVTIDVKGANKSVVTVEHRRLADAGERDQMKAYWRERLSVLKAHVGRDGGSDV